MSERVVYVENVKAYRTWLEKDDVVLMCFCGGAWQPVESVGDMRYPMNAVKAKHVSAFSAFMNGDFLLETEFASGKWMLVEHPDFMGDGNFRIAVDPLEEQREEVVAVMQRVIERLQPTETFRGLEGSLKILARELQNCKLLVNVAGDEK